MEIVFTARRFELNQNLKDHITRKLEKLDGMVDRVHEARVTLTGENYRQIADIRFKARGQDFVAASESSDMTVAADQVFDRLERQLRRFKDRRVRGRRGSRGQPASTAELAEMPPLTRYDQVSTQPMTVDEALELLDDQEGEYLVFSNTETTRLTVLYRRQDGSYGLIEPTV